MDRYYFILEEPKVFILLLTCICMFGVGRGLRRRGDHPSEGGQSMPPEQRVLCNTGEVATESCFGLSPSYMCLRSVPLYSFSFCRDSMNAAIRGLLHNPSDIYEGGGV